MPRRPSELLTTAEWKIMRIVWERKACATRDVHAIAKQTDGWSRSTVKTILSRLADKGYLKVTQVGNSYLYRPARPALKSLLAAADTLLENALAGTTGPILAHMIKKCDLSAEEIKSLQALLEEHASDKEPD
jgi:predicted transcriptional regulator